MKLSNKVTPHETFDLHELLVAKTVAATKCATMAALVKDEELKSILQQDLIKGQNQIKELKSLLQQSVFYTDNSDYTASEPIIPEY